MAAPACSFQLLTQEPPGCLKGEDRIQRPVKLQNVRGQSARTMFTADKHYKCIKQVKWTLRDARLFCFLLFLLSTQSQYTSLPRRSQRNFESRHKALTTLSHKVRVHELPMAILEGQIRSQNRLGSSLHNLEGGKKSQYRFSPRISK